MIDAKLIAEGITKIPSVLNQMGYADLRTYQKEPIMSIMGGNNTFVIMPTGGGKTLVFALPTKCMGWKTVVFSPLIALQTDQVTSLNLKGIRSGAINSQNSESRNSLILNEWVEGKLDILYVAPERILTQDFKTAMNIRMPDMVVLDEAHTMSQWSSSFRPAYKSCGEVVSTYNPKVVVALTATATNKVIDEVVDVLKMGEYNLYKYFFPRDNLNLSSSYCVSTNLFQEILKKVRSIEGSIIIYADTTSLVEDLTVFLSNNNESVTYYHGKITSATEKLSNQSRFMSGDTRIMVCTNAFGMGIDKPDIRAVIHATPPGSVEAIAQETGRASRDGKPAVCHMFYTEQGMETQIKLCNKTYPTSDLVHAGWIKLMQRKDKNNEVRITAKDLAGLIGDPNAESVLGTLLSIGCIERYQDDKKDVYTIEVLDDSVQGNKILDCIKKYGKRIVDTASENVYSISLNFVSTQLLITLARVKTLLSSLRKEGVINYADPFRGKVTKLIKTPTKEDYEAIDYRLNEELKKKNDVMLYCNTPDKDKWKFIIDYFDHE